jgi:hypothetical protein
LYFWNCSDDVMYSILLEIFPWIPKKKQQQKNNQTNKHWKNSRLLMCNHWLRYEKISVKKTLVKVMWIHFSSKIFFNISPKKINRKLFICCWYYLLQPCENIKNNYWIVVSQTQGNLSLDLRSFSSCGITSSICMLTGKPMNYYIFSTPIHYYAWHKNSNLYQRKICFVYFDIF